MNRPANHLRKLAIAVIVTMICSSALSADINIDSFAGVYRKTFANGNIDGGKYQSEDILEIVKVSPSTAYIRTHLEFFNGHVCNIWGVAKIEGDALVYRGPSNIEGKPCVLSVKTVGGKVTLFDEHDACTVGTCGNRGMYTGEKFDLKTRRAIRYMDVLTKSEQYTDAVKEYDAKSGR
ncbi:MAG: hypothetical protein ACXWJT_05290 [Xanthobacteraceae bacterium]